MADASQLVPGGHAASLGLAHDTRRLPRCFRAVRERLLTTSNWRESVLMAFADLGGCGVPSGRFCTNCGQLLSEGSFCGSCGSRVAAPSAQQIAPAQQASPQRIPPSEPSNTVAPPAQTTLQPQATRASRKRMSVAWALGLLISAGSGLLIGYLVFNDGDGSASPADDTGAADPATANIDFACDLAERISQTHGTVDDWGGIGEDPAYEEALAVGQLIVAVAIREQQYEHWGDLGRSITGAASRLDIDQVSEDVSRLVRECNQL